MSTYTTGQIAKKANVSVRTIQYYDRKDLLNPATVSEGGRRLYTDHELQQLQLIQLLKSMGLSLTTIKDVLESPNANQVLDSLLVEQTRSLTDQIKASEKRLTLVEQARRSIGDLEMISPNTLTGIETMMKSRKKLRTVHITMMTLGVIMDIIEISVIVLWAITGIWYPALIGLIIIIGMATYTVHYYYQRVRYVCPQCHTVFQPPMKSFFFSRHTAKTRKLTCPHCGYHGYCVEVGDWESN